ncbi:MAG: hypothetical protein IT425_09405 [Pirellulales bacterium]|nr:hypothetical protein [Pirellulales bacterium]
MSQWWLVSWTTYGTWLPGDPRGFCTWRKREYVPPPKRYAQPGEATYQAAEYVSTHTLAKAMCGEPVYLTPAQMQMALSAIVEEIAALPVTPVIIALGSWHVHWLCNFGTLKIRPTIGRVKAAATRVLNEHGFQGKRPWTKGCNMRSKPTREACRAAYRYVRDHRDQGSLVYEWPIDPNDIVF